MARHDPLVRLRHMLDYSREAVQMVKGKTRGEFPGEFPGTVYATL